MTHSNKTGWLRGLDRFVDAFCGHVPESMLALRYSDFALHKLREIYAKANLRILNQPNVNYARAHCTHVADDILRVFRKSPHLELPFPRKVVLKLIEEMFTDKELKSIEQALLTGYLRAIPKDLELLKPEQYAAYLLPAFTETPDVQEKFQEKDWVRLFQIPEVSDFIDDLLGTAEKNLEESLSVVREIRKQLNDGRA